MDDMTRRAGMEPPAAHHDRRGHRDAMRRPSRAGLRLWFGDQGSRLTLALGVYALAVSLWLVFRWGGSAHVALIDDLAFQPLLLSAAALAWRAGSHATLERRIRRAWRIAAVAFGCYWLGEALWAVAELVLHENPFPSWADAAYLCFYPALFASMLAFAALPRSRAVWLRLSLDAGAVVLGAWLIVWYFVLRPTADVPDTAGLTTALSLAYPIGDLVLLLGVTTVLFTRSGNDSRGALSLLVAAVSLFVVADLAFSYLTLHHHYETGDWPDVVWLAAEWLMVAAGQAQWWQASACRRLSVARPDRDATPPAINVVPYVALAVGCAGLLVATYQEWAGALTGVIVGVIVLNALVIARQVLALRDNARLSAALGRRESRFRALVQHAADAIAVVDQDGIIVDVSPSVERLTGWAPTDVVGHSGFDDIHPDDRPDVRRLFAELLKHPGATRLVQLRIRHADGGWRWVEASVTNLLQEPAVAGIVANYHDITDRKTFERQLLNQARQDPLTGLPNRSAFRAALVQAASRASARRATPAVLFLDLDGFKVINDSLGHGAGDQLLIGVAGRLRAIVRPADVVARLGGDEFTLLLPEVASEADAVAVAERLLQELTPPFIVGHESVVIGGSIGIALVQGGSDADDVLRRADLAMYHAKAQGRARWALFTPSMSVRARERLLLEADLRRALADGELHIVYQPEIDLASGDVMGVEALVRWRHPTRGPVAPAEFVPVAEESGLIEALGRWVLRTACRQMRRWQQERPALATLHVSVNVSARQFQRPGFVDEVREILHETGLPAAALVLEITESAVLADVEQAGTVLRRLRAMGVALALDDFGTGYSSLGYLHQFPVDILKIDKSFVDAIESGRAATPLVEAIVTLGRMLGVTTVAEGIERAEQADRLREMGCARGQGFHLGRPLEASAMLAYLCGDDTVAA